MLFLKENKKEMHEKINSIKFKFDLKYLLNFFIGKGVTTTRYLQDRFIEEFIKDQKGRILELGSVDKDIAKNLAVNCSEFIKSDYEPIKDDVIKIDATNIDFSDNSFDCVIAVSLLEHIYEYQKVIDEIYRILKHDGRLILACPFIFPYHPSTEDYFRYSPAAYRKMLSNFSQVDIYGLGNVDFSTSLMLQRKRWHADFCHLDNKAGFFNHILSFLYLLKGFLPPVCYYDDYATVFGVVAKK